MRGVIVGALLALLAAVPAAAGEDRSGEGRHRKSPEPVTLVGLGLGAAAIGGAAWRARRKQ